MELSAEIFEVRFHGRGGQGAWTASQILALAALREGKYIQSFPEFGPERMGAPIKAYTRISDKPIEIHCGIYEPHAVVVLDPTLLKTIPVAEGLRPDGKIIINTRETPSGIKPEIKPPISSQEVWVVPATDIAVEILGRGITNTAMIGALVKATGVVSLDSVKQAIRETLGVKFGSSVAEKNIKVVEEAYAKTVKE